MHLKVLTKPVLERIRIFDNHFRPVETMMRDIARATGGKKTEVSDAPYTEDFYDGISNTYMEFAKQVFKYLD